MLQESRKGTEKVISYRLLTMKHSPLFLWIIFGAFNQKLHFLTGLFLTKNFIKLFVSPIEKTKNVSIILVKKG